MSVTVTNITEYNPIEAVIADLTARHKGVIFDVGTTSGMQAAKAAAKDIAQYRIALEKKRTELKADVLVRGRLIDGEAKRIATQLAALEDPIVDQIKAEERRIEAEREALIRAEQERLAAEERARKEAEERKLAEARAQIEAERKKMEEERAKIMAEERERRRKLEEEEAASRARIREAEEKYMAERRAAEELAAAERRAKEEAARQERERLQAEQQELMRRAEERMSARQMLVTFVQRFNHVDALRPIVAHVRSVIVELDEILKQAA